MYESPQFQQWVTNSRRKIAMALHNLGDEIHPREMPLREDISMSEDPGEVAEERREIARAEIMRRSAFIKSRRESQTRSPTHNSFDALVDVDGNLRDPKDQREAAQSGQDLHAKSTGLDLGISEPVRRSGKVSEADSSTSSARDALHIQIPSSASSNRSLQPSTQLTPTSDDAENELFDPFSPGSPVISSGSSHTEDHQPVYYAHPDATTNLTNQNNVLELDSIGHGNFELQHEVSAAPSTSGSFSHIGGFDDGTSDGTLSDFGTASIGGVATPASWSEVGSVISDEDAGHHQLL